MAVTNPYMYKDMYLGSMTPEQAELILSVRECENIPNLEQMIFDFPPELVKQSIDEQISIRDIIKRDGIDYTQYIGKLRKYQTVGAAFMYLSPRSIIADGVGFGKTVEISALINYLKQQGEMRRFLIAVETSALGQTQCELIRFTGLNIVQLPSESAKLKKVIPKIEAMKEKFQYLQGVNLNKESYLGKFNEFEKSLCDMDSDYKIDSLSVAIIERLDIKEIRLKRQKNAKILYEGIKKFSSIKPLVPNPDLSRFCPLFVPVIVTNGKRNELHKHLIKHNIYCPIHWPKNWGADTGIEEIEISLICDQRYDDSDMRTILETIRVWDEMNV